MRVIDLNCDMGELEDGGEDASIMPYLSSANIACGGHAGDESSMRRTIRLALHHRVAMGAHPSFPDRSNFGRTAMTLPPSDVEATVKEQVLALKTLVEVEGGKLHHVKPHGALYNMAAKDPLLADAIARAVFSIDPDLILYGLSGSELLRAGQRQGLKTAHEVFSDRTYLPDGSLTPRTEPGAFITDPDDAARRVLHILQNHTMPADTVCIHGDAPSALAFAQTLHQALTGANIRIAPP